MRQQLESLSMSSHAGPKGQNYEVRADQPERALADVKPRAKPKSSLARHVLHSQTDATDSNSSSNRSHRRLHRFKHHDKSPSTSSRHADTSAYSSETTPDRSPTKANFNGPEDSTDTVRPASMIETERSKSRKERTFVGGSCAACELSLEHKLSGEKVLQFSCGHVVHEACLYEYISGEPEEEQTCPECDAPLGLDSTRGGNILDLNRLTSMVRSIAQTPGDASPSQTSLNVDGSTLRDEESNHRHSYSSTYDSTLDDVDGHLSRIEKLAGSSIQARHRNDGANASKSDDESIERRKHDYDLQAMEGKIKQMEPTKNIPRPKVTIRSEFPTLTRSTQPQSVTCLVTVEVPATRNRVRQIGGQHPLSALPMLTTESPQVLEAIAADLKERMDNWHGLEPDKFGPLRLHTNVKVGRDGTNWQKLDCFLFSELLICVREKKATAGARTPNGKPKFQLKGSILIRKHLNNVESSADDLILTLNLNVATLPIFRLKFTNREQLDVWKLALVRLDVVAPDLYGSQDEQDTSGAEEDDFVHSRRASSERPSSISSSTGTKTGTTAATDYADIVHAAEGMPPVMHVPLDIVVVIPMSSSMQGLKIKLVKDALRFLLTNLGEHDRMGLVTYGSSAGAMPLVGMATKDWDGWREVGRAMKPVGQRSLRADPIEGANVALDLLSQRKVSNLVTSIILISDSQASDSDCMDLVVRRAHESKISIYSFGLGQTHKADSLIELSTRTNAAYIYVKDWMMLRECVAGCLGSLQSLAHLGAKLKLKIPEGSVAKFVRISGALHTTTKRSTGREAEATLGGLRFGDKRDILVQLVVEPDSSVDGDGPHDHWESIVTGLATLGGSLDDTSEPRPQSVEEVPLLQADLTFGDFEKGGSTAHLSHPSLLTITMLPTNPKAKRSSRGSIVPPIPSHPSIVQRRMEMLTSDMLGRALSLVAKGQSDNAHRLLTETRTILQGLGKGSLPPLPPLPPKASASATQRSSSAPRTSRTASPRPVRKEVGASPKVSAPSSGRSSPKAPEERRGSNQSLPPHFSQTPPRAAATIDPRILHALDSDIEACMEYMNHPTVFSHDARKAALQTIGVISSQRAYTFRTETESIWAGRIKGIKKMGQVTKDWQMVGNDILTEEL